MLLSAVTNDYKYAIS